MTLHTSQTFHLYNILAVSTLHKHQTHDAQSPTESQAVQQTPRTHVLKREARQCQAAMNSVTTAAASNTVAESENSSRAGTLGSLLLLYTESTTVMPATPLSCLPLCETQKQQQEGIRGLDTRHSKEKVGGLLERLTTSPLPSYPR